MSIKIQNYYIIYIYLFYNITILKSIHMSVIYYNSFFDWIENKLI